MSPPTSDIARLKITFSLNSMEFVTFNQFFSIFFVLREGGFAPDPTEGYVPAWTPLVTEPTLLPPPPKQIPDYAPTLLVNCGL